MTKYENSYHLPSTYVIFWDMLLLYRKYKAKEVVMLLQEFIEFSTYHSEWLSGLTCPQQIQPKSRRTGAVLTRRMDTYNEVVLTKVASNHTT